MQKFEWRDFEPVDFKILKEAKAQYHQAIQSIAAVGRKFLKESKRDKNATLAWVPGLTRLAGRWVDGSKTFRTSISFEDFTVYLVDEKINIIASFVLEGKSQNQLLIWLEEQIGKLDLDASDLTMNLPYKMPKYEIQPVGVFSVDLNTAKEFSKYFHNSFICIRDVARNYGIQTFNIQTWPHHFDQVQTIILKNTGDEETDTTISLGMSPGDEEIEQPYFYVNTWPHVNISKFEKLSNGAEWHERVWTGAVLRAEHVANEPNQKELIESFYIMVSKILSEELMA